MSELGISARVSSALEAATSADAVIIASASESHVESSAKPLLELGKPVLIEKPLAPTLEGVDVLLGEAAKHDVLSSVASSKGSTGLFEQRWRFCRSRHVT